MNVFRKKTKAKDDAYIIPPALPSDPVPVAKMSRSLKRKQKNVAEPKAEIDLATVLPDTNDFRTSLLMPGLSARFSMLREQDDPSTLVGKASDDSVLFPKRASRLNLFSHNPLTDIAEVSSIRTAIRAPFAEAERAHSFTEGAGYASDDAGNVMARARATEGNNLFGGRQKMYRIPNAGSSRDLTEGAPPLTSSRHLYQDDVTRPTYPDVPFRGRDEHERDEYQERPLSVATEEHEHGSVVNTPSTGFSKSRGTASSTASGPSNRRTSTAATSVISDSPVPRQSNVSSGSNARMRASDFGSEENVLRRKLSSDFRKPGHGADHHDKPPLPMSPRTNRQISLSRSATNLSERHAAGESSFSPRAGQTASPPPTKQTPVLAPLDFGLKATKSQLRRYQTTSPTYEGSDVYHQSLEPNDRGKATAMGLFNRPRQQFDEQKFEERQLQMHEGKVAPSSNYPGARGGASAQQHETAQMTASVPCSPVHSSFHSSNVNRSRAQSSASSANPAQVHAQVEALIRRQNEEYTALQTPQHEPTASIPPFPKSTRLMGQHAASRGTFLDTFDGSDEDEDEVENLILEHIEPPPRLAPSDVHPALRDGSQAFDFGERVPAGAQVTRPQSNASVDTSPSAVHDTPDTSESLHRFSATRGLDSPTIGPTTGLGLSGLIQTHLRQDSDKSSLHPPSPSQPRKQPSRFPGFRERELSVASTARTTNPPESTHSDPWEFDSMHRPQRSPREPPSDDPTLVMSQKAQQILGQALSHRNHAASRAPQALGRNPLLSNEYVPNPTWPDNIVPSHQRGESTETQKEFGNELAERARRIQEGLKGVVDSEKRSRSPIPGQDRHNPAAQALHVLRHKASKASLPPRANDSQPKAMKMLGLAGVPKPEMGGQSPNMGGRGDFAFERGYDDYHTGSPPRERVGEFDAPGGRRTPGYGRPMQQSNRSQAEFERSRQRSATPTSGRAPRRERVDPEHGERSRSRVGRHRDEQPFSGPDRDRHGPPPAWEQQRAHALSQGPASQQSPRGPHTAPRGPPPVDPRSYERSASAMSARRPSGTRPEPSGYFDGRAATPVMAGTPQLGNGQMQPVVNPPRPSPRPPFPHSPMSPLSQAGLSPALSGPPSAVQSAYPSPVGPLPPLPNTGRSTPVDGRTTPAGARKKSVTKGMISEPTFISSTSSVPLVGLPRGPRPGQIASPPVPAMNPRRRGNTMSERPDAHKSLYTAHTPMAGMADSQGQPGLMDQQQPKPAPRQRNRLRKISSEGGSMAARARQQAMMSEFGHEKLRSPALPVFPNRSATSLGLHQDGGMF